MRMSFGDSLSQPKLHESDQPALRLRRGDEARKERMRIEGAALQFGMILHADEPGMIGDFDGLGKRAVWRGSGEDHPLLLEPRAIGVVDLVAMAVALGDVEAAVNLGDARTFPQSRRIGAEPHRAAKVAARAPLLELIATQPFGQQADDGLGA